MIGAHASFTLSDDSLGAPGARSASARAPALHVHVAEDRADVEDCRGALRRGRSSSASTATACSGARTLLGALRPPHARRRSRPPRPRRLDRAQPALEHEQRGGLRADRGPAARRAGHRRHGRGHAGGDARRLPEDARRGPAATPMAAALELLAGGHRLARRALRPALRQAGRGRPRRPRGPRLRPAHAAHTRTTSAATCCSAWTAATCASVMVAGRFVVRDRRVTGRRRGRRLRPRPRPPRRSCGGGWTGCRLGADRR